MIPTISEPDAPATDTQIHTIKDLLIEERVRYMRTLDHPLVMRARKRRARVLLDLVSAVHLPSDLTTREAMNWIGFLKNDRHYTGGVTLIDLWLDRPDIATAFGIADYVNQHRAEIEGAVRSRRQRVPRAR